MTMETAAVPPFRDLGFHGHVGVSMYSHWVPTNEELESQESVHSVQGQTRETATQKTQTRGIKKAWG